MKIIILNTSKLPIYEQIINSIKDEIIKENLKECESLAVFIEESAKTQFVSLMLNSVKDII